MSGSPKMVTMYLEGQGYVTVTEAQAAALELAERARRKAAEQERARQLYATRRELDGLANEVRAVLESAKHALDVAQAMAYENELNRLAQIIQNSPELGSIHGAHRSLIAMRMRLTEAQEARQRQAELAASQDKLSTELALFDSQLNSLRHAAGTELDRRGRDVALAAVNTCRSMAQTSNVAEREAAHAIARQTLEAHTTAINTALEAHAQQLAAAKQLLAAGLELAAAFQADELLQRWTPGPAAELAARVAGWQAGLEAGDLQAVTEAKLEELRRAEATLREQAATAQFKAEQRDYILRSLREVLSEMGFELGPAAAEHPGHPASAVGFLAVNAAGQEIGVSVPLEGEIQYDIEGFPKTTEAKVGGGSASVCDSAQGVLEEMHSVLADSFGIKSGELMWEGKDPQRILRQADQLPRSGDAPGREGRR